MTAWIITKDKIADESEPEGTNLNAKGLIGPGIASDRDKARLLAGEGRRFRMLDDDGEVYYYGRNLEDDDCTEAYEEGMWGGDGDTAPFDDFGRPNAGCAQLEYAEKDENGKTKWVGLF